MSSPSSKIIAERTMSQVTWRTRGAAEKGTRERARWREHLSPFRPIRPPALLGSSRASAGPRQERRVISLAVPLVPCLSPTPKHTLARCSLALLSSVSQQYNRAPPSSQSSVGPRFEASPSAALARSRDQFPYSGYLGDDVRTALHTGRHQYTAGHDPYLWTR